MAAEDADPGAGVQPDPGGIQSAIDRYRDLAKYLITIFAGVGALLVAGTQLASIGRLSFEDHSSRVLAVIVGLALAVGAVVVVVGLALRILRPVEMTFDEVVDDPELRDAINRRPSLLGGAHSVEEVRDNLRTTALTEEDRASWYAVAGEIVGHAAYRRMQGTFEGTWVPLLFAAIVGVIGITAFAWGANPPAAPRTASAVVSPAPVPVQIRLTADGREALAGALGGEACTTGSIPALVVGGSQGTPRAVTLPRRGCRPAQFVLSPAWGAATAGPAPVR